MKIYIKTPFVSFEISEDATILNKHELAPAIQTAVEEVRKLHTAVERSMVNNHTPEIEKLENNQSNFKPSAGIDDKSDFQESFKKNVNIANGFGLPLI